MDPDLLAISDRGCLRLLLRCGAATSPLAANSRTRTYPRSGTTAPLYRAGFLERTTLPRRTPGHADLAYRLTPVTSAWHQTRSIAGVIPAPHDRYRRRVCALNRTSDREHPPVQLAHRLNERSPRAVRPTGQHHSRHERRVRCPALEMDEGTEHRRTIRPSSRHIDARSRSTELASAGRGPGPIRAAWMARVARSLDLGSIMVVTLGDLERDALDCVSSLSIRDCRLADTVLLQPPGPAAARRVRAGWSSRGWRREVEDGVLAVGTQSSSSGRHCQSGG